MSLDELAARFAPTSTAQNSLRSQLFSAGATSVQSSRMGMTTAYFPIPKVIFSFCPLFVFSLLLFRLKRCWDACFTRSATPRRSRFSVARWTDCTVCRRRWQSWSRMWRECGGCPRSPRCPRARRAASASPSRPRSFASDTRVEMEEKERFACCC
jgi:hypothetical protein